MSVYNLPPVTKDGLSDPISNGEWLPLRLDALARSLRLDKAPVRTDELKSIPDVWAQAQLTTDAFFDQDHDAHEDVVAQWRGLLALFALQPLYASEYDLHVKTIDLNDNSSTSKLREILRRLLPGPSASLGEPWDKFAVVEILPKADPQLRSAIAFLSPSMLVAPGRAARETTLASVPWLSQGPGDPTKALHVKPEAAAILIGYLEGMLENVRSHQPSHPSGDAKDTLIRHLSGYLDDCRAQLTAGLPTVQKLLDLDWPSPLFSLLGDTKTIDLAKVAPDESDCLVSTSKGSADSLYKGIILVDSAIAKSLKKAANSVRVWKHYTLHDALSPATLAEMKTDAQAEGFFILELDDLFTRKLVELEDDAVIRGHPASLGKCLLPLSPVALLLKNWSSDVRLNVKGSDRTFSFEVELARSKTRHRIQREFNADNTLQLSAPSDVAVWPNFKNNDWPWTFLRFQYDPRNELITRFATSADLIASHVKSQDARVQRQNLEAWADSSSLTVEDSFADGAIGQFEDGNGRQLLQRFRFIDEPHLVGEQHRLPHGADAIFFAVRDNSSGRDLPIGCVKLDFEAAPQSVEHATVAFDFGTSNTIAYARKGAQPPQRIFFQERVLLPFSTPDDKQKVAAAYTDFFPVNSHDTPVPTISKRRDFGRGALPVGIRQALNDKKDVFGLDQMVFFMPRGGSADSPSFLLTQINKGWLNFNIKWGEKSEDRKLVKSFLRQLMMMVAAELRAEGIATSQISWRFSYPQAFSQDQKQAFQAIIKSALDNVSLGGTTQDFSFFTEADAAMRYFTQDPEQERYGVGRLVIMFDIGGGTSDIAIWKDQGLLWRGSARLAGAHFFADYLRQNMGILSAIDKNAVNAFQIDNEKDTQTVDPSYRARQFVELLIARPDFAAKFKTAYPMHSGDQEWSGLRRTASTALAGLHHYAGLVLRELKSRGMIDASDLRELTITLGGRGSTIFRQLNVGDDTSALASIARIVAMGDDILAPPEKIEPRFSSMPKEEVARGMLLDADAEGRLGEHLRYEPVGLGMIIQAAEGQIELRPADDIRCAAGAADVKELSLDGLKQFLGNFAQSTGISISIDGLKAEQILELRTRNHLKTQLAKTAAIDEPVDTQDVEAPFITALRNLIEVLSLPVDERDQTVLVKERR
jgi:hypothetical protein